MQKSDRAGVERLSKRVVRAGRGPEVPSVRIIYTTHPTTATIYMRFGRRSRAYWSREAKQQRDVRLLPASACVRHNDGEKMGIKLCSPVFPRPSSACNRECTYKTHTHTHGRTGGATHSTNKNDGDVDSTFRQFNTVQDCHSTRNIQLQLNQTQKSIHNSLMFIIGYRIKIKIPKIILCVYTIHI